MVCFCFWRSISTTYIKSDLQKQTKTLWECRFVRTTRRHVSKWCRTICYNFVSCNIYLSIVTNICCKTQSHTNICYKTKKWQRDHFIHIHVKRGEHDTYVSWRRIRHTYANTTHICEYDTHMSWKTTSCMWPETTSCMWPETTSHNVLQETMSYIFRTHIWLYLMCCGVCCGVCCSVW